MKTPLPRLVLAGSLALLTATTHAATLAYYEFEDSPGFTIATTGPDLTAIGTPTQVAGFSGTGEAASVSAGNNFLAASSLALSGSQFTIESYFRTTSSAIGSQLITGEYDAGNTGPSTNLGYFFGINNGQLRLGLSSNGTSVDARNSNFAGTPIVQNNDYYGAVSFNAGSATFYLQNLTTSGPLTSTTVTYTTTSLFNSTAALYVGRVKDTSVSTPGDQGADFTGILDQVRISDTALSQSQLLIPEPSTAIMLLGGAGLLALSRRHRG